MYDKDYDYNEGTVNLFDPSLSDRDYYFDDDTGQDPVNIYPGSIAVLNRDLERWVVGKPEDLTQNAYWPNTTTPAAKGYRCYRHPNGDLKIETHVCFGWILYKCKCICGNITTYLVQEEYHSSDNWKRDTNGKK